MKKRIILIGIFVFLFFTPAAAQISIEAEVDKVYLSVDETVTYKLTVVSSEKNIPAPQLPDLGGFYILSSTRSSSLSLGAAQIKTVLSYTFILAPITAGELQIEPASIKTKNETYSTKGFKIQVVEGKTKPRKQPGEDLPHQEESLPEPEEFKITL